jgi:hypothetical protein
LPRGDAADGVAGSVPSGLEGGLADAFTVDARSDAPLVELEVSTPSTLISFVFFDASEAALANARSPRCSGTSNVFPAQKSGSVAAWTIGARGERPNVKVSTAACSANDAKRAQRDTSCGIFPENVPATWALVEARPRPAA